MKIAIIGSREGFFEEDIYNALKWKSDRKELDLKNDSLISGGARGVDQYAESFFKAFNLPIEIIRPINPSNKMDYLFRNVEIITRADKIIAFWNGYSKGTKFVIDYAKNRNKEIVVILSDKTSTLPNSNPNGEFNMGLEVQKSLISSPKLSPTEITSPNPNIKQKTNKK